MWVEKIGRGKVGGLGCWPGVSPLFFQDETGEDNSKKVKAISTCTTPPSRHWGEKGVTKVRHMEEKDSGNGENQAVIPSKWYVFGRGWKKKKRVGKSEWSGCMIGLKGCLGCIGVGRDYCESSLFRQGRARKGMMGWGPVRGFQAMSGQMEEPMHD